MTRPTSDRLDAYLDHLVAVNPASLRVWVAEDESEFCAAAEDAVEHAITQIESGARLYASLGELPLSHLLVQLLSAASIHAAAERYHNGHVDVTIEQPVGRHFVMLGECKLYAGFQHHCDGCRQLLDRYSTGRATRVFCLEFVRSPAMYQKLETLRKEFDSQRPLEQTEPARDHRVKGAFLTAHRHFTATVVEILHLGCSVFHPQAEHGLPTTVAPEESPAEGLVAGGTSAAPQL